MTVHRIFNTSKTTGITSGERHSYLSGVPEFIPNFIVSPRDSLRLLSFVISSFLKWSLYCLWWLLITPFVSYLHLLARCWRGVTLYPVWLKNILLSLLFIFVLRKRNKWIVMFYMHAVIRLVVHHLLYMVSYPCSINPNRSFENGIRHACTSWPKHNTSYNKLLVSFCQCKRLRTEIKILGNALSRSWLSCLCPVVHLLQHTYILCSFRI
jgi:hypothetical protein